MKPAAEDNLLSAESLSFSCLGTEGHKATDFHHHCEPQIMELRVQRVSFMHVSEKKFTSGARTTIWLFLPTILLTFQLICSILLPQITKLKWRNPFSVPRPKARGHIRIAQLPWRCCGKTASYVHIVFDTTFGVKQTCIWVSAS